MLKFIRLIFYLVIGLFILILVNVIFVGITSVSFIKIPFIEYILENYIKEPYIKAIINITTIFLLKKLYNKTIRNKMTKIKKESIILVKQNGKEIKNMIGKIKIKHILSYVTSFTLVILNLWTALEEAGLINRFLKDFEYFKELNIGMAILLAISLAPEGFATFSNPKKLIPIIIKEVENKETEEAKKIVEDANKKIESGKK